MRNNVHATPDDIDPVEIFSAIKRNFAKLILASLLVGLATYVILSLMTPKYKSVAQLQFGGRAIVGQMNMSQQRTGQMTDVLIKVDKQAVASQVAVIKSRDLALQLIADLNLKGNQDFNPSLQGKGVLASIMKLFGSSKPSDAAIEDQVLTKYDSALKVFQGKDSRVISIQFTASNAQLAARAANRLAELYLASRATRSVKQSVNASLFLKPEIIKLQTSVQVAEASVEEYRGQHNLFAAGPTSQRGTLNNEQLSELTRELTRAQGVKSEAEARAAAIRSLIGSGSADASRDVMRSPLIQRLQGQRVRVERQVSELSATLLPAHPRMRQLRADLGGLNRQIKGEVRKIADSMGREAKVASLRVISIQANINQLKSLVRSSGGNRARLAELERGAKAKRQQLEAMQARYQKAISLQQTAAIPLEAELFSKARASTIPAMKKGAITALTMAGTFLLGLAFIVTKALLVGSRSSGGPNYGRRASDHHPELAGGSVSASGAAPAVNGAVAGSIPGGAAAAVAVAVGSVAASQALTSGPRAATSPLVADPVASNIAHSNGPVVASVDRFAQLGSVDSIVRHITAQSQGQMGYRTLITTEPDGMIAADEAMALVEKLNATGKQVILVDWSPSGNGLAARLQVEPRPGLMDLLQGQSSFEDVIKRLPSSNVHFIPTGTVTARPDQGFDPERLNLLLDALDEAYDHIVVHADYSEARDLFETIQGRFDAGISVADANTGGPVMRDVPGTFLGFEVDDLDVIQYQRGDQMSATAVAGAMGDTRGEVSI